jgi:purine-binding chemotaxis protein CheW
MAEQDQQKSKIEELDPAKIIEEMREEYWKGIASAEDETEQQRVQLLIAEAAGERFAMDAVLCRTITKAGHVTRVPRTPGFMLGVINLRGQITPVIDLAALFRLPAGKQRQLKPRYVVVEGSRTAFAVDRIAGIDFIDLTRVRESESISSPVKDDYIKGHVAPVADEGWMTYLDMVKIIEGPELSFGRK